MLLLAALAFALLHMAFVLLSVLVVAAYWDTHRHRRDRRPAGASTSLSAWRSSPGFAPLVAASPAPLAATLGELNRDLAQLRGTR